MGNKWKSEGLAAWADLRSAEGCSLKCSVLFLALLLSACASVSQPAATIEKATGAAPDLRKSDAESRPAASQQQSAPVAAPQPPAPVEAQQPAPSDQVDPVPKKKEHNIEED